jgi:hypothetical protein
LLILTLPPGKRAIREHGTKPGLNSLKTLGARK